MVWSLNRWAASTGMDENGARLRRTVYSRFVIGFFLLALLLFLPAGSLSFWEGWLYMGVLFIPILIVLIYLLRMDPALLERRMRTRETESEQRAIIRVSAIFFLIGFIIPGLDFRFGWSDVPVPAVLLANMAVLLGYILFFWTIRENSYASRVVEVEEGQKVISSGPYAIVRHPMYLGALIIFLATPLALGSYWAILAFFPSIPILGLRILNEEEMLVRELPGYREYRQKVRYRLIPFVW
jgi:protein-S-isoprenylcysteine O-methyltransferase Ste14